MMNEAELVLSVLAPAIIGGALGIMIVWIPSIIADALIFLARSFN